MCGPDLETQGSAQELSTFLSFIVLILTSALVHTWKHRLTMYYNLTLGKSSKYQILSIIPMWDSQQHPLEVCELLLKTRSKNFEAVPGTKNKLRLVSKNREQLVSTGGKPPILLPLNPLMKPERTF